MKIFHVQESWQDRWVLDPVTGPAMRHELVAKQSTMGTISVPEKVYPSLPDGATFDVGDDGSFEVPDEVGAFFLRMPGWHAGVSMFPKEEAPAEEPAPKAEKASAAHKNTDK